VIETSSPSLRLVGAGTYWPAILKAHYSIQTSTLGLCVHSLFQNIKYSIPVVGKSEIFQNVKYSILEDKNKSSTPFLSLPKE
jgi:hypothetical protein